MLKRLVRPSAFKVALFIGLVFSVGHFLERGARVRLPYLDLLEAKALDWKFELRGPLPLSHKVALAEIDDRAVQKYGLWPWNRALVGRAVQNLVEAGAASVALDMVFSDPDRNSAYQTLSAMKARLAQPDSALPQSAKAVLARAPDGFRLELQPVLDAALREHDKVAENAGLLQSALAQSPDASLAAALKATRDRAVLGTIGLDTAGARAFDLKSLEAWKRTTRRSLFIQVATLTGNETPRPLPDPGALRWSGVQSDAAIQAWLPELAGEESAYGAFSMGPDPDGVMRRYDPVRHVEGGFMPSLALAAIWRAAAADMSPEAQAHFAPLLLASRFAPGSLEGVTFNVGEDINLPVDGFDMSRMLINYLGPNSAWRSHDERLPDGKPACTGAACDRVSMADVLGGTLDPASVKGKVVFVGVTALGTFDQRVTPFSASGPGVYVHMSVAEDIASNRFLQHPSWLSLVEAALLLVVAIGLGLLLPRIRMGAQLAVLPLGMGGYFGANLALFKHGTQLFTVTPLLEIATVVFGVVVFQYFTTDKEKRQVRTAFQYYLTESVMTEMLKDPDKLKLGGEKKNLTVLFSDIRGFTTLSEMLEPGEVVRRLNEYLTPMTNLVFKTGGTLDKYMGDAIMAFWGAPVDQPDHALRACETACAMLAELDVLRAAWKSRGEADIDIGIGLNSGNIHVGNMGSDNRFDYTVIGDDVNLGSRLEGTNKSYGTRVIIGENTYLQVKGKVVARELGGVMVKGKKKPVTIFELRRMGSPNAEEAAAIAAFEHGLTAYRARDWDGAEGAFNEVLRAWPNDGPCEKYLEDIAEKRAHPPDAGWDGVYVMKTK